MGLGGRICKDSPKNSPPFSVFVKQQEKCTIRIILAAGRFRGKTTQEKHNPDKKQKKLHPGLPFPGPDRPFPLYFALAGSPEARPEPANVHNLKTRFHMEFLNRIVIWRFIFGLKYKLKINMNLECYMIDYTFFMHSEVNI